MRQLVVTVCVLRLQGDCGRGDLIESRHDASIRFVAALRDDERGELARNVDVGLFECTAGDAAEPAGSRPTDRGLTRGQGGSEVIISRMGEALLVSEAGQGDLSDGSGLSVAEGSCDCAIGTNVEILQRAAAGSVLLDRRSTVWAGQLCKEPDTGIGYMPRKGKLVGSIGENRLGGGRSSDGRD